MVNENLHEEKNTHVGQMLKSARLARGLTLDDVSKNLCISKNRLSYLEEEDEKPECNVYTLGFLKSYALFLGLDEKELCQQFKNQALHSPTPHLLFPAPLPGKGMPSLRIISISLLFLIISVIGWKWLEYQDISPSSQEQKALRKPTIDESKKTDPINQNSSQLAQSLAEHASATEGPVLLQAVEKTWVEVKNKSGTIVFSRLLQPSESQEFKNPQDLTLKTGNAKGIELLSGGKKRTFPEGSGIVRSDIPLDPEKWVEQNSETQ